MTTYSTLTRLDYEKYLIYLYFGSDPDLLTCINRAYLDLNRTMHGFAKDPNSRQSHDKAVTLLMTSFESLKALSAGPITAEVFDNWHKVTCDKIVTLFDNQGFHFYIGQAQKWINMTLKYVFTLGDRRIQGFGFVYPYCHMPLDNILLERLKTKRVPIAKLCLESS